MFRRPKHSKIEVVAPKDECERGVCARFISFEQLPLSSMSTLCVLLG